MTETYQVTVEVDDEGETAGSVGEHLESALRQYEWLTPKIRSVSKQE